MDSGLAESKSAKITSLGYPPTIPQLLGHAIERFADRVYIVDSQCQLTFREVEEASRYLAKMLLAIGVGKGTRVAMMFPQGSEFAVAMLGITRIGALAVPLSTFYRGSELRKVVRHADVDTLLSPRWLLKRDQQEVIEEVLPDVREASGSPVFLEDAPFLRKLLFFGGSDRKWGTGLPRITQLEDSVQISDQMLQAVECEVAPADLMVIVHTSGATAEAKGVVHTHGAQVRHSWTLSQLYGMKGDERTFTNMPFFWVGGLTVILLTHLHVGSTVITIDRMDTKAALDLIEKARPNRLIGWALMDKLATDSSYPTRDITSLPDVPQPGTREADPELHHNSLGMSETSGPHTAVGPDESTDVLPDAYRGSFGRSIPGLEHLIVDPESGVPLAEAEEGEIYVRGYSLMNGLYKKEREEIFDQDGWYHTGDLGHFKDGLLFFKGRLTDMIKSGGANVAPSEVELALEALPSIKRAVVVGVPDSVRGEIVASVVCPSDGATLDVHELRLQLSRELSSYKIPRLLVVMDYDDLPLLLTSKVDRRKVAEILASTVDTEHWEQTAESSS